MTALSAPAISRYGASSPELLRWFTVWNRSRAYRDQVKPFGFLLAMSARLTLEGERIVGNHGAEHRRSAKRLKPIAAYDQDHAKAVLSAFDRQSGEPVPATALKTYREALAQYHIQPESKFLNADYLDRGVTTRRHVRMIATRHIGKESNDWERQAVLGWDAEAQPDYGVSDDDRSQLAKALAGFVGDVGLAKAARTLRTNPTRIKSILSGGGARGSEKLLHSIAAHLPSALEICSADQLSRKTHRQALQGAVKRDGLRTTARRHGFDPSNLRRMLATRPADGSG